MPDPTRRGATSRTAAAAGVVAALVVGLVVVRIGGRGLAFAGLAPAAFLMALRYLSVRATARRHRREIAAALPRFADLVAACLESGASPADAVDVVRRHVGGPVAELLAPVAGALRSGVDPLAAYGDHGRDNAVRGLVVALSRAMESGAPLADTIAAIADDQRLRRRWSAEEAARRAGVHAVGPLVICFLPAFVLLGVVPVVLGIASEVLGDLS
jgi:pilus assembly protein TadC